MRFLSPIFLALVLFSCTSKTDADKKPEAPSETEEARFKNAIIQFPDSILLIQNLAGLYMEAENYEAASTVIDKAISRNNLNPDLWDMRAAVLVAKGDTMQAISSLERAVDIYPLPHYIISLGALYAETKNPMALEMADALLIADKTNAEKEAYFIKGLFYSFSTQSEKAIPFFDRALAIDPRFMDAYLEKGLALYNLKKYNEGVTVLTKAVTLQNNFDRGYYYLGQCYEKLNKKAEAAEAYTKALLYDPNYIEARAALDNLKL